MATIHFHEAMHVTPEQFIAALTDFGPGRSALFANSADDYMNVHDERLDEADVTEGSHGVWERLHYDWSNHEHVVLTTTDSNVWSGRSRHTYTFTRQPDGTTTWTSSSSAKARTSRAGCSRPSSGQSARAP
jgi:hypothetical protein